MVSCCGLNKDLGACGSSDGEQVNVPLSSAWTCDRQVVSAPGVNKALGLVKSGGLASIPRS